MTEGCARQERYLFSFKQNWKQLEFEIGEPHNLIYVLQR